MSVDSSGNAADLEYAHDALGELRTVHDEFESFFGEVFDELQTLSMDLFARHKCLEHAAGRQALRPEAGSPQQQLGRWIDELRRAHAQILAGHQETQHAWGELCDTQRQLLRDLESAGRQAAQQRESFAETRRATVQQQAELAAELQRVRSLVESLIDRGSGARPGAAPAAPPQPESSRHTPSAARGSGDGPADGAPTMPSRRPEPAAAARQPRNRRRKH